MYPTDSYTPFGYLANPTAFARSWRVGEGGSLRSTDELPGFGWWYPFHQRAIASYALELQLQVDGRQYRTRRDWDALGLHAQRHGAALFTYAATRGDIALSADFFLAHQDALVCAVSVRNSGASERGVRISFGLRARHNGRDLDARADAEGVSVDGSEIAPAHALIGDGFDSQVHVANGAGQIHAPVSLGAGSQRTLVAVLGRGDDPRRMARNALPTWQDSRRRAEEADDAFWRGAARLEGDWPAAWRRGWVYDLETARLCLSAAGGIFPDAWPIWSANWPRAVLAEAALDMPRLALGAPELAQRAILSLFRAAAQPNVPCVFLHGEPNMVAADGHACGTSLAWCLPFRNLAILDRMAPDPAWRAALYPYLAALLDWWLEHRTDADGWLSYHCTWEAGEDGTPRLDPTRSGDGVIRGLVRPAELQAAAAQAAKLLQTWAAELGRTADVERWRRVRRRYVWRTRQLWDAAEGRFRDQDARGAFLGSCGDPPYWGDDPCRSSALALIAALDGVATPSQRRALAEREVERFLGPPWSLWPSWTWTVAEAAHDLGRRDLASRLATSIVRRVYPENDRRPLESDGGPLPGVAREWWPLDLGGWNADEAYGWGGTTALLLLRHIFGILEPGDRPGSHDAAAASTKRRSVQHGGVAVRLAPALPDELLGRGHTYAMLNVPYGGVHIDVAYTVANGLLDTSVKVRESGAQRTLRMRNASHRTIRL
jgi:hypothetical protein